MGDCKISPNFIKWGDYMKNKIFWLYGLFTLVFVFLMVFIVFLNKNVSRETLPNYYPNVFKVENITDLDNGYLIQFVDENGNNWNYVSGDGDIYTGETYAVIMYDNETPKIYDDEIVKLKYIK